MIEVSNIRIPVRKLDGSERAELAAARRAVARTLGIREGRIQRLELRRRSVDARKRDNIQLTLTVRATVAGDEAEVVGANKNARIPRPDSYALPARTARPLDDRPIVVGAGCAGLFCALALASAGLEPLLVERGDDAQARTRAVRHFERTGELDPESNIQFGLGGAGTFSDGKLTTGTKSPAHRLILQTLVDAGAQRRILWDAKPHVGSDVLPDVVGAICDRIRELGGEVRFRTRLSALHTGPSGVEAVTLEGPDGAERVEARHVVLATGHSARDVFALLREAGVAMEPKTFAVGVRVEHLQARIDRALFGRMAAHPALGPAPYKLAQHSADGRGVFSFCMCPGGYVVAATSERGGVVTNGMSLSARDGANANSALLVNVFPEDWPVHDVLGGVDLQRDMERRAFAEGLVSGPYAAPAQLLGDFLQGVSSSGPGSVEATYPRGVSWGAGCTRCLPSYVREPLAAAIARFDKSIHGFAAPDAVLTGMETRSSSPVRIVRSESGQSVNVPGLWPCGEGAGYAGGIMSAAADGLRTAEALIASQDPKRVA